MKVAHIRTYECLSSFFLFDLPKICTVLWIQISTAVSNLPVSLLLSDLSNFGKTTESDRQQ